MPVSIVVGGQFGSEGKGKVTLEKVRLTKNKDKIVVRVGGPNSGHTGYDRQGRRWALRQMPAGCIDKNVDVVFPAGSYIDPDLLLSEISELEYPKNRIFISKYARVISAKDKAWEQDGRLIGSIGSTGSGVGGAVMAAVARGAENFPLVSHDVDHCSPLASYVCDTTEMMAKRLNKKARIFIEGSQGFGLSLLDGGYWPKATSRLTTAAGALAEAGLSPVDVDDVTLVLRTFPIRVGGDSGPLLGETTWEAVASITGRTDDLGELTTVTKKLRRVGCFDNELVKRAIAANNPTEIVLNHLDYLDQQKGFSDLQGRGQRAVREIERGIGRQISWVGFSGRSLTSRTKDAALGNS